MKKFRSLISLLCVCAIMLISIPVMTFSAFADTTQENETKETNTKVHYFSAADVTSTSASLTVSNGNNHGITLQGPAGGTVGVSYWYATVSVPYEMWSELSHIVMDANPYQSTAKIHTWLAWDDGTEGNFFGALHDSANPSDYVGVSTYDMTPYIESHKDTDMLICLYIITSELGETLALDSLYMSSAAPRSLAREDVTLGVNDLLNNETTITVLENNAFTASVPSTSASGYAAFQLEFSAAVRSAYRYLYINMSGDAYLHLWIHWKSNSSYWLSAPYHTAAPTAYSGTTVIDLQAETSANANDTAVITFYVLGPNSGGSVPTTAGSDLTINSLVLSDGASAAASEIRLLPNLSSNPNASSDGGYYTTGEGFSAEDYGDKGVKLHNNHTDSTHVVWALPVSKIASAPYLVLEVDQEATTVNYIHLLLNDYGGTAVWVYNWTPVSSINGKIVINLYEALEKDNPNLYVYFDMYLLEAGSSTLALNSWYLTSQPNEAVENGPYYDVSFETNGGSSIIYTQQVPAGGTVDPVADPVRDGYQFNGWYTNQACTVPYEADMVITEETTLYAAWLIGDGISSAYAQIATDTTATSQSSAIRFVAAISSLAYEEVGFIFSLSNKTPTVDGTNCTVLSTKTVYESIRAGSATISATQLNGKYIVACMVTNIPQQHFGTDIYVTAYTKTMDGEYFYSETRNHCVDNWINGNVTQNGAVGNGVVNDAQAFINTIKSINNSGNMYIPAGNYYLASDFTVPEDVVLIFDKGALLTVAPGTTVTIKGYVVAGAYKIFDGAGTIAGTIKGEGYAQWFGVVAGPGYDNAPAMTKAINALEHMILPYCNGTYYYFSTITITKPITIEGRGAIRTNISNLSGNGNGFVIASSNVSFKNLYFWGNSSATTNTSSALYYFDTSSQNINNVSLFNCYSIHTGHFVADANSSSHVITNASFVRILADYNYNIGMYMTDFDTGIVLNNVLMNRTPNHPGFHIINCNGMNAKELDAAFGYGEEGASGGHGFVFENCKNIVADRAMVDYVNGIPFKFVNCSNLTITDFVASLYDTYGFWIEGVTDSTFSILKANGCYDNSYGLYLRNCHRNIFDNIMPTENSLGGMKLHACTNNLITNLMLYKNGTFGYAEEGSCDYNTVIGGVFNNNSGRAVTVVGSHSCTSGLVIGSRFYSTKTGAHSY